MVQTTKQWVFRKISYIINSVRILMSFVANWRVTHDPGVKMAFLSEREISQVDAPDCSWLRSIPYIRIKKVNSLQRFLLEIRDLTICATFL